MRRVPGLASIVAMALLLSACALPTSIQVAVWAIDGITYATTDKSLTDNGLSIMANRDCAVRKIVLEGELCQDNPAKEVVVASKNGPVTVKRINANLNKRTAKAYKELSTELADASLGKFNSPVVGDVIIFANTRTSGTDIQLAEVPVAEQKGTDPPIEEIANFETAAGEAVETSPILPVGPERQPAEKSNQEQPISILVLPEDEILMALWSGRPNSLPQIHPRTGSGSVDSVLAVNEPENQRDAGEFPENDLQVALWQSKAAPVEGEIAVATIEADGEIAPLALAEASRINTENETSAVSISLGDLVLPTETSRPVAASHRTNMTRSLGIWHESVQSVDQAVGIVERVATSSELAVSVMPLPAKGRQFMSASELPSTDPPPDY